MIWKTVILGVLTTVLGTHVAAADTVVLSAKKDNTLYATADGSRSNGAGELLFAGRNSQPALSRRRAVVAFDVAGNVPAGSTIDSATLVLSLSQGSGSADFTIHRLHADWGEGASDAGVPGGQGAPAATGDATWLHRFFDTQTWSTGGGDFDPAASGTAHANGPGDLTWASSQTIIDEVQQWLDTPAGNFGWIVLGDESAAGTAVRIASREHSDPTRRPTLILSFTPPPVAIPTVSAWGVIFLALSLVTLAKCRSVRAGAQVT